MDCQRYCKGRIQLTFPYENAKSELLSGRSRSSPVQETHPSNSEEEKTRSASSTQEGEAKCCVRKKIRSKGGLDWWTRCMCVLWWWSRQWWKTTLASTLNLLCHAAKQLGMTICICLAMTNQIIFARTNSYLILYLCLLYAVVMVVACVRFIQQ